MQAVSDTETPTISKGAILQIMNEPFKLSTCSVCNRHGRRVRKDNRLCERCMVKLAPAVEGLCIGYRPPKRKADEKVDVDAN